MPVTSELSARFCSTKPGKGSFTLIGFSSKIKDLGNTDINGIDICVAKKDRPLADWYTNTKDVKDGFIKINKVHGRRNGMDFIFEVDATIVDPMAWDSTGDYLLKIKGVSGTIYQFAVATDNMPIASSSGYRKVEDADNRGFANIEPKSKEAPASNANLDSSKANSGVNLNGGVASGANNFGASAGASAGASIGAGAGAGFGAPELKSNPSYDSPKANSADPNHNLAAAVDNANKAAANANAAAANAAAANNNNKSIFIMKIVGIVCVILLLIGAALFVMNLMKGNAGASAPVEEPQSNINQACSLEHAKGDDKDIINNCLQSNPTADDLNYLLANAMKQDRCEIVLRVLRTKGRAADGSTYAYVYSQYADPNSSYKSKCINKSQDDATYWAERVKSNQSFNQAQADELLKSLQ